MSAPAPLPQELIRKKRDGGSLSQDEIEHFVRGVTDGSVQDSQIAALAMAVYFQDLSADEMVSLTRSMRDSGRVLNWSSCSLDGPVIDKHSTGGVGDVVSLILGPLLAACGGYVPMVSGRGLGHTGGTVDKLESIPGYNPTPPIPEFQRIVREVGVAIVGQTDDIAPADRRIYSVRDVTATVESIGLITSSILSKKLAAGLDALVMDVKVGSGAFMPSESASRELAKNIVRVACGAGTKTSALLTDMNQCLARSAGNAVEVSEAVALLRGEIRSERLLDVTLALGAELLVIANLAPTKTEAIAQLRSALDSGQAAERFDRMTAALGGPNDFVDQADQLLPVAPLQRPVFAAQPGLVQQVDVRRLGGVVVGLGGGRTIAGQSIDPAVGLTQVLAVGEQAAKDQPLAILHARDEAQWGFAADEVQRAYVIGTTQEPPPLIVEVIQPDAS